MIRLPPTATRTYTLFPYTPRFRAPPGGRAGTAAVGAAWRAPVAGLQPAQRAAAERPHPLADAIVAAGGVRTGVAADPARHGIGATPGFRSEEHTSELQS